MSDVLLDVLRNSLMISSFVLVIMLFIEVLNVATNGRWNSRLVQSGPLQVLIATLLGSLPGCFGGFAVVSLYTHGVMRFGALIAAMIVNIGDEAFVMLVQMPHQTLWLMLGLFALAMVVGLLCNRFVRDNRLVGVERHGFDLHEHECLRFSDMAKDWKHHLRNMTFARALLLAGLCLFLVVLATGGFEHHHHDHTLLLPIEESWFNAVFYVLAISVLVTVVCASDHFLEHHLWQHVIKHHFPKLFLWTFAALLAIHFIGEWVAAVDWIGRHSFWMLVIAVLVGLIPESGPHLLFVSLYVEGHVPFGVLLANAIVQDGHAALPLFAESKRSFVWLKLAKVLLAVALSWMFL